ncbi:MAG TPA: hypothetical protein VN947_34545 [Polyangia bacterium]|nr:hypothetical protein [Polyangia bacterium]
MRVLAFCLTLGAATVAAAARPADSAHPAEVFGVADVASPTAEYAAWANALTTLGAGAALPPAEVVLPTLLGRLVGAPSLDGVALDRPLRAVVLDPQKIAPPVVLAVTVRDLAALRASLHGTALVVQARRGQALVGGKEAVALVAGLHRLPAPSAESGVHATLFVPPVWAAFGPQLIAAKTMLASQPESGAQQPFVRMYAAVLDQLLSGAEACEQLGVDIGAAHGLPELTLRLEVKHGSTLDRAFSAQRPSDFGLLGKLPASQASMVAGGRLDLTSFQSFVAAVIGGGGSASDTQELTALLDDFSRVFTGDLAMAGTMGEAGRSSVDYLAGVRDVGRAAELYPRWYALFNRIGLFGGSTKITQKQLASEKYDGLSISRSELDYDFSKLVGYKGPAHVTGTSAYAAFDGLLAMAVTTLGGDRIHGIIDSARHGRSTYRPEGAARASLDAARAAHDSLWMWADLGRIAPGAPSPLPRGTGMALGVGFGPAYARLHLALTAP